MRKRKGLSQLPSLRTAIAIPRFLTARLFRVTTLEQNKPGKPEEDFFGRNAYLTVSGQLEAETFAWLCTPDGRTRYQDKIVMTRFERELWNISGGRELEVFDIPGAKVGVLICYDSEFPLLARQLCESGADILIVPGCTDTEAGYHRVMEYFAVHEARKTRMPRFLLESHAVPDAQMREIKNFRSGNVTLKTKISPARNS